MQELGSKMKQKKIWKVLDEIAEWLLGAAILGFTIWAYWAVKVLARWVK